MTPPPDTIRSLLLKLKAFADDPRANPHEREVAESKLAALLEKYGLTAADLLNHEMRECLFIVASKVEVNLLVECATMITDKWTVRYTLRKRSLLRGAEYDVRLQLTCAEHMELINCFAHYRNILNQREDEIRAEQSRLRRERKLVVPSIVNRFHIRPPSPSPNAAVKLSPRQTRDLLNSMYSVKGDRWTRKAGELDNSRILAETSAV